MHAEMQKCNIQHPEDKSEAEWFVTVADKAETDKTNREGNALNNVKKYTSLFFSMCYSGLTVSVQLSV